jgi:hypothetical protein
MYQYNKSDIQISYSMGDKCEVYDAELNALTLTAERIEKIVKTNTTNYNDIWIFCDSQAAINTINSF